jgi:hypothetical protein
MAVVIVIAAEEPLLPRVVPRVVRRVEIEHDLLGRLPADAPMAEVVEEVITFELGSAGVPKTN